LTPRAPQVSVDEGEPGPSWTARIAFVAGAVLLMALLAWGIRHMLKQPLAGKRQVARITLLPDQPPPPPPPPPKEEKPPEPKEQMKQVDTPKQDKPPEPQQIKMEGPAGDAPSPFAGGDIKQDYIGGDVGNGRDKYAYYTDRLVQEIQEQLARKNLRNASGQFLLWLGADGTIKQFKLLHSTGNADTDRQIQGAVAELGRVQSAPPADMPMPVGLDVSTR
jgi:protein TonB